MRHRRPVVGVTVTSNLPTLTFSWRVGRQGRTCKMRPWAAASFAMLVVVALFTLFVHVSATNRDQVYATTLSSNSFLLGTRVLGYALRRLNATRPFLVLCTSDISEESMDRLQQDGFIVRKTTPLHTPYKATHVLTKYQYTKIRLWAHTDYSRIVHIDADCLPVANVDELFDCGDFCAVMRHSDMFNSGVFTLTPNQTIYEDMMQKMNVMESYDGGDQGFLNSYFSQLTYSNMFNGKEGDSGQNKLFANGIHRLSFFYNTDVGMYYLNSQYIRQPKIIHYTLGPVKPWIWWTYPLFDQNWQWLEVRDYIEARTGTSTSLPIVPVLLIVFMMFVVHNIFVRLLRRRKRLSMIAPPMDSVSGRIATVAFIGLGAVAAYSVVPEQLHPYSAWSLFAIVHMTTILFFNSCYCCSLRIATQGVTTTSLVTNAAISITKDVIWAFAAYLALGALFWRITCSFTSGSRRVYFALFALFCCGALLYAICRRMQVKKTTIR